MPDTINKNSLENLKQKFLNMQSPDAFGAIRRLDSLAFMNIPAEMARRDAAYVQFEDFLCKTPFQQDCEVRRHLYTVTIARLQMVLAKTEYIRKAEETLQCSLETGGILSLVQLILKYFQILDDLADSQMPQSERNSPLHKLFGELPGGIFSSLEQDFYHSESTLFESIKATLLTFTPILSAMQESRRKQFAKSDSERYEKAYAFYLEYYSDIDNI